MNQTTHTMPRLLLLLAEVIGMAILATVTTGHFGLADGAKITVAFLVAYAVPRFTLTRAKGCGNGALLILLLLAAGLISLDVWRLMSWTKFDEFSLSWPNIKGDGRNFYKYALSIYNGESDLAKMPYPGYPYLIVGLWKLFGVSAVWPQALNLMFTLTSVVLTGLTTRRLLGHRVSWSPRALVLCGMLLHSLLPYYLFIGSCLLKDGVIYFSIALAGFALSSMAAGDQERHWPWRDLAVFVTACILLALVRTTYLYLLACGVVLMALPQWRRDWRMGLMMIATVALTMLAGNQLASYSFDRHVEIMGGGWNMQRFYVVSESQQFYHDLLNYYFLYSPWHKALMLPLTMSVQFIIPFPWVYYGNPRFLAYLCRMTYGWYAIGGVALFYYLFISWRRHEGMGAWPWWPALIYAGIAYVMAGSVARYSAAIEPLFIPVAVYVLCRLVEGRWRKLFTGWAIFFVILVAATLLLCLEIQQGTISKRLHTESLVHYLRSLS